MFDNIVDCLSLLLPELLFIRSLIRDFIACLLIFFFSVLFQLFKYFHIIFNLIVTFFHHSRIHFLPFPPSLFSFFLACWLIFFSFFFSFYFLVSFFFTIIIIFIIIIIIINIIFSFEIFTTSLIHYSLSLSLSKYFFHLFLVCLFSRLFRPSLVDAICSVLKHGLVIQVD